MNLVEESFGYFHTGHLNDKNGMSFSFGWTTTSTESRISLQNSVWSATCHW